MSSIDVGFAGDVLLHGGLLSKARGNDSYNFDYMLHKVDQILSADLNVVNQESLAAGDKFDISSYPLFNSPVEILHKLKELNVGLVNVANNHMLDKGENGLIHYLNNLKNIDLDYVGASLDDSTVKYVNINGFKLSFVSYTDGSKIKIEKIKKSNVNFFKGESYAMRMNHRLLNIKKDIKEAKSKSDFVVLMLHFGEEYFRHPNSFQRDIVNSLVETDVDIIIGHHPHVLQPMEWVENSKGKSIFVAYSLGNFFSGQIGLYRQIGCFLNISLTKNKRTVSINKVKITPTFVDVYNEYKLLKLKDLAESGLELKTGKGLLFPALDIYNKVNKHLVSNSLVESSLEVVYE